MSFETRAEAAPSSMCKFSILMHPATTNQQQRLVTGSMKWKVPQVREKGTRCWAWLFYPTGLLHEWRMGPFCHSQIQKTGRPHLQQGVTTLQCNVGFVHCKIAFSLIDSAVMCLRRARSSIHNPTRNLNLHSQPLDLIANEAQWSVWLVR